MASKKVPAKKDPAKSKSAPTGKSDGKSNAKAVAAKTAATNTPASKAPATKAPATKAPTAKALPKVTSKAGTKRVDPPKGAKSPAAAPAAKANSKTPAAKGSQAKTPAAKTPAAKTPAAKTPAAKTPAAKSPEVKSPEVKTSTAKTSTAKASTAKTPAAAPVAKAAPAAKSTPSKPVTGKGAGAGKSKSEESDTPVVPKKGPIDLAQHRSVAEAAAAVANARGGTGEFIIINGRRVRAISTKGLTIAKKSKSTSAEATAAPSEQQIREIKTKLGKKELDEYRVLLHAKRRQLVGMLSGMEDEALRSSGGNLSNMPVHMADMGSDVYEQDFTLGMAETERAIITEIDAALQRIEDKTFGVCQMTGKPISKARLDAKPWAKYTIEAERIAESSGSR